MTSTNDLIDLFDAEERAGPTPLRAPCAGAGSVAP